MNSIKELAAGQGYVPGAQTLPAQPMIHSSMITQKINPIDIVTSEKEGEGCSP